jgi:hypothetical protein
MKRTAAEAWHSGDASARPSPATGFSPSVRVRVYRDSTLLAEDTAWPAGMRRRDVAPGQRAAVESLTHIPGESTAINHEVSMPERHTVEYPKR